MSNVLNITSRLTAAVAQKLARQALVRMPLIRLGLCNNKNRREGKRDAHFAGQAEISTVQFAEICAKALAEGQPTVKVWIDLWMNEPSVNAVGNDRPILSGRGRTLVEGEGTADGDDATDRINELLAEAARG